MRVDLITRFIHQMIHNFDTISFVSKLCSILSCLFLTSKDIKRSKRTLHKHPSRSTTTCGQEIDDYIDK